MTDAPTPIRYPLEQVFNLRDLGGYPTAAGRHVRVGQLLRSDGLNRLTDRDVADISALGIRTVIDLRTDWERNEHGVAPGDRFGAEVVHLPIIRELWPLEDAENDYDPVIYLSDRYHEMSVEGAESIARIVQVAAHHEDQLPLAFHCSAGKDRTGVVAAVLLGLLGVSSDIITADYAHSALAMAELAAWIQTHHPTTDSANTQPLTFLQCPAEAMERFLGDLTDRFGSIEGYVRSAGVDDATLAAFRERHLTD